MKMKFSSNVMEWPPFLRKLFVLTLPISVPLWLLAHLVIACVAVIVIIIALPVIGVHDLWVGKSSAEDHKDEFVEAVEAELARRTK
uniref:Transmembrane protein n=1 Tax=Rhizobium phage IG49 TaxID=3129228 RepID=A0AAU8HYR6_9CAUD